MISSFLCTPISHGWSNSSIITQPLSLSLSVCLSVSLSLSALPMLRFIHHITVRHLEQLSECCIYLPPSLPLFLYLSISLSFYPSIFLSFYLSIFLSFSLSISLPLSLNHSIPPSLYPSITLSFYFSISARIACGGRGNTAGVEVEECGGRMERGWRESCVWMVRAPPVSLSPLTVNRRYQVLRYKVFCAIR